MQLCTVSRSSLPSIQRQVQCKYTDTCGIAKQKKNVLSSSCLLLLWPEKITGRDAAEANFIASCEHWHSRTSTPGILEDVYDGKLWQEFLHYNGRPFLAAPYHFGLLLNIDWFQPYKHTTSSVGVIYLTVLNLPRSVRYKRENVIIVGIIPGPNEPSHNINSYLQPLVDELLDFWNGVKMLSSNSTQKTVRCLLLGVSCDLPAGRKVCGFLGHSAKFGCSKCLKEFPGSVGSMDYSGFDRENWGSRTNSSHRQHVEEIRKCTTKSDQARCESLHGCRYSELLRLPYFDAPRMTLCIIYT